jgi:hypothetical protein
MTVEDTANGDSANIVGLALAAKQHGPALRAEEQSGKR